MHPRVKPAGDERSALPRRGQALRLDAGVEAERARSWRSGQDLVLLEPVDQLAPGLLRLLLAVAWPVVGMEAVRRAVIDMELGGLAGRLELGLLVLDLLDLDASVLGPVETQHRSLHLA